MGSNKIPTRIDGKVMDDSWFNLIRQAICNDVVPRDLTTGVPTAAAGSMGVAADRFKRAYVQQGYFDCGDLMLFHSFNGAVPIGEGWMLCDGRTVSSTNYDTEHGSGHWSTYIGSSPLNGLKLPDFTGNKYPVGAATTPADGSGAIPTVGNASSQVNIQHFHALQTGHAANISDTSYNAAGNDLALLDTGAAKNTNVWGLDFEVDNVNSCFSLGANNQLSSTQSVQPDSVEFGVYMRII